MSYAFRKARFDAPTHDDLSALPEWARLAYADLATSSTTVGAGPYLDDLGIAYLTLSGAEEGYWPARAYWREMVAHMGEARRRGLAMARLWPEYQRFRQGRRSPGCTEVRRLTLAGKPPAGLDCLHAARCEHCRMFTMYAGAQ